MRKTTSLHIKTPPLKTHLRTGNRSASVTGAE